MKFVLPLNIKIKKELDLPIILVNERDTEIQIRITKFPIKEKEQYFGIKNLSITKKEIKCNNFEQSILSNHNCFHYIHSNYKIEISANTDNPAYLQKIYEKIDFAFKIVLGYGFTFYKIIDESKESMFDGGITYTNKTFCSRRNQSIRKEQIKRIKVIFEKINDKDSGIKNEKLKLFEFFIEAAMSQMPNTDIAGALYVSILESILVEDRAPEIKYRFSMRLSKIKGEDKEYQKRIGNLYNKRSSVFHGNRGGFSKDDLEFLEKEACLIMEEYLLNGMHPKIQT